MPGHIICLINWGWVRYEPGRKETDMIYENTDIYEKFVCIGGDCPETCCQGWEVDIDDDTFDLYMHTKGEFGDKLRSNLKTVDGDHYFPATLHGNCPFLRKDGLCDIYSHLGEDALCEICSSYPRYYQECGDYLQTDLSLSCMEVGRLFFTADKITYKIQDDENYNLLVEDREAYFAENLPDLANLLKERDAVIETLQEAPDSLVMAYLKDDTEAYQDLLLRMQKLEVIHEKWPPYLEKLSRKLPEILKMRQEFMKEKSQVVSLLARFAEYLTFRYYIDSTNEDETLEGEKKFIKRSLEFVSLTCTETYLEKGDFTVEDMIHLCHEFSREVEHSDENQFYLKMC